MAYVKHCRVTCSGILGTVAQPAEIFSWGFQYQHPSPSSDATLYEQIATLIYAYHQNPLVHIASNAFMTNVKFSEIDETGHVIGNPYNAGTATPVAGGVAPIGLPFQVAMGVSLRTGNRGISKRGRFYLPVPGVGVNAGDGLLTAGTVQDISDTTATLLTNVNTKIRAAHPGSSDYAVCVASSKGYNTVVTAVNVGRVLDTQRRRRNALPETYNVHPVV